DLPKSPISESYRMLQANLKFLSSDRPLKTIVVTSAVPGEGKTLVSANLAMAMAQNGHKVLLIDADLRCGRQHQVWNVINDSGLSNVIVEQLDPQAIVKSAAPNLDLLTAGVIPPNPAALLDSQRMASLIRQFSAHYDFVIIDTPSVNIAADGLTLGKMADGVLLVTRPGVVDVGGATIAIERLEQSGQTVLGQVINSIVPENEPDSYHYFMRSYGEEQSARLPVLPRA
ncbi:MAG: CpsD/CapB family tyrosine-protein kinase, partial [Microcoleus sp. SIO2G3]|nr:CpsD/CapB family tyrosine-protein kinase [Microcoleus sp. SIO2G3]